MPPYFFHGQTPESRRRVLPGYPKDFVFKDYNEYKQYFVGDRIICLLCGKHYRTLGNHLRVSHEVEIEDYKKKYGILWTKSLACNELHKIHSDHTKERIANGELIPKDIEGRRKQGMLARKQIVRRKRNLPLHAVSSNLNLAEYNIIQKRFNQEVKEKKDYPPHVKSFIESYAKKGDIPWNKGKKTSEEARKKMSESAQMRHSFIKEFK